MSADIATLSIGAELLLGQIADTNAAYIAQHLIRQGWRVGEMRTVDDTLEKIVRTIKELTATHRALIITGGLGPTKDDLTRSAIAKAAEVPLHERPELIEQIAARFRAMNHPMSDVNRVQALLPEGAACILNPQGTAPGIDMYIGGCRIFSMPGVPREMKGMLHDHVLPALGQGPEGIVRIRNLHCVGMGESSLGEALADLMQRGRNPDVGTRVKDSLITVRIVTQGATDEAARALEEADEAIIRERLGRVVYGTEEESLEQVIVTSLMEKKATLAIAESCTGGMISAMLTDIPGSSNVLMEGAVTYSNEAKINRLGIDKTLLLQHGAVSEPVARAMAEGIRTTASVDYGIGVTGIAGPGGGSDEKPVGLVHIAVAGPESTIHAACHFLADRHGNRQRAANRALAMLREMMLS